MDVPALQQLPLVGRLEAMARRHLVPVAGARVCWRAFGAGSPVVLLHGGHGSWLHWLRNIDALAQRHTVWVADMPGYGDSDDLPGDALAPDRLERLVAALVESFGTLVDPQRPIGLAGFSFGTLVASQFAQRRGHLRRIALLGPTGPAGPAATPGEMRPWRLDDRAARLAALQHNLRVLMLHHAWADDPQAVALHEAACLGARFRTQGIAGRFDAKASLDAAGSPLLLLWGEHDVTAVPSQVAAWLGAGRHDVQHRVVAAAGHWVQYEQADAVNALLSDWFATDDR